MAQVTVEAKYVADTAQYVKALRTAAHATMALADQIPGQVQAQDNLRRSTEALGQGAEEASKGFTILRNAMGTALGVAAVNLVSNLTGRLKGFAMASFDAAARVEELDIAMNSIGEATGLGADAIKEATQAIRDNGIELAAAQQIAIEFAQNQLDLASAQKVARVAQDLAVIAGQNSTATTQLLTQAIITGNSMLLKSAGISRLASEGYAEYAKQIGKSVRQLSAQERQQAVTNLILQEGERVAGTYEGAMNAAGKVLRSFKRIINDIQIEIGKILLNAFGPLIKSTYDLLKAFSQSMREGGALSGTLTMLSENFQTLTEPLVEFIQNLTESVKSGEAMANIGNAVETIIPPLMAAVDTVRALGATYASILVPALRALTPLLTAVANLLVPILKLFTSLPEPIRMVIGLFVLLKLAMARSAAAAKIFGASWVTLQTTFVTSFVKMANGITAFELRWKTARISSIAGMKSFATAAKLMAAGTVAAFRTIGAAAKGLMASFGPIGIALLAFTAAMEIFMGRSQAAEARVDTLKATVDELTGAFTEASTASMSSMLRDEFSEGDIQRLADLGITMQDLATAALEGGQAADNMAAHLQTTLGSLGVLDFAGRATVGHARNVFRDMVVASDETRRQVEQDVAAQEDARRAQAAADQEAGRAAMAASRVAQAAHAQEVASMGTVERAAYDAEIAYAEFANNQARAMDGLKSATVDAVNAMSDSFAGLKSAMNIEASMDSAHDALLKMRKQLEGSKKGIDGFSKGAKANRKVIRDYANEMISFAETLDDPRQQMEVLQATEAEVRAQLQAKNINPEDSAIYQEVKRGIDSAQSAIDEMGTAVDKAKESGISVTQALVEGIVTSIDDSKGTLDAAGQAAGQPLVDGLMGELQINSPSQVTLDAGKSFVDGLVLGIQRGQGRVAVAMRSMVRAGINAAKDEAGISSPSKVTDWLGEMHAEGLKKGIEENADKPVAAAKRVAKETANAFDLVARPGQATKIVRNFMKDLVDGIRRDKKLAEMEVSELGQGMLDALESKMDEFATKVETAAQALENLGDLTEGLESQFGLPTQIEEMFGEGASASGILGGYRQLSGAVREMFAPMLDEDIVPKKTVRKYTQQMKEAMAELDRLTQFAVDRVKEREALNERMRDLDKDYSDQVAEINQRYNDLEKAAAAEMKAVEARFKAVQDEIASRYDALDRAAAANIKRIEQHYDDLIPTLEAALKEATAAYDAENKVLESLVSERNSFLEGISKGFRGFLNNLRVDGDKATRTITRTTEKIVDGIKVLTQESFEEETAGGGFAEALQGRLQSLRDFTSNIRSLLSRGLDPTLVRDFVSAGVDSAGETVAALASGSNEQIAQINSAQNELGSLIEGFQQESSAQWFDYGIAQQEAIVAPLQTAAQEAQLALEQAKIAREQELAAAKAHAEALRLNRQAELAQAQADRDAEVARIQAYQEQLREDRDKELKLAKDAYDKEKKQIEDRLAAIEVELKNNAQEINTTFLNLRGKLLPKMQRFGERIINGLLRGLRNREGALYAKADAIANGIRARIAAAFDFGSPSKVTTKMGEQIAQGLIAGMENETRAVMRAADSLAEAAMVPITMPRMSSLTPSGAAIARGGAASRAAGGGSSINITVNAGMGADGAEVGRQVVEAIRKYERRSGPVFVSAP